MSSLIDVPDRRVKDRSQEYKNEVDGDIPVVSAEYRKELRESDRVKKRRLDDEGYSSDDYGVKEYLRIKGDYPPPLELGPPQEIAGDQHVAVYGCVAYSFHYPGEVIIYSSGHAQKDIALCKEMEHYDHEHGDDPQKFEVRHSGRIGLFKCAHLNPSPLSVLMLLIIILIH